MGSLIAQQLLCGDTGVHNTEQGFPVLSLRSKASQPPASCRSLKFVFSTGPWCRTNASHGPGTSSQAAGAWGRAQRGRPPDAASGRPRSAVEQALAGGGRELGRRGESRCDGEMMEGSTCTAIAAAAVFVCWTGESPAPSCANLFLPLRPLQDWGDSNWGNPGTKPASVAHPVRRVQRMCAVQCSAASAPGSRSPLRSAPRLAGRPPPRRLQLLSPRPPRPHLLLGRQESHSERSSPPPAPPRANANDFAAVSCWALRN